MDPVLVRFIPLFSFEQGPGAKPIKLFTASQVLHSRVGSWPYPQTLDLAVKACHGQTLQLLTKISKLRPQQVLYDWS